MIDIKINRIKNKVTTANRNAMMYTRSRFGVELKERIFKREDVVEICKWAYETFLDNCGVLDEDFLNTLLTLNTMELGPEFSFTYEELNKIADDLIAGKDVQL